VLNSLDGLTQIRKKKVARKVFVHKNNGEQYGIWRIFLIYTDQVSEI